MLTLTVADHMRMDPLSYHCARSTPSEVPLNEEDSRAIDIMAVRCCQEGIEGIEVTQELRNNRTTLVTVNAAMAGRRPVARED
jgi:hypothetical protein